MDQVTVTQNYRQHIQNATFAEVMQAATWYSEAQDIARQFAIQHNVSLDIAASVIAAFSPRTRWAENVLNAHRFLSNENVPTLGNNIRMARNALLDGFNALKGRKTNSFARNIAGDMQAVTIDVWMIRAAGYERNDANKSMYDMMESAICELAYEFAVEPAQIQALIWIVVRGSRA